MENVELTPEDKEIVVETHIFSTLRYKNEADNGFSGNIALLVEAVQNSDKVLDDDIKLLAKGILSSVIKHKIIVHSKEDIEKALAVKKANDEAKKAEEDKKADEEVLVSA